MEDKGNAKQLPTNDDGQDRSGMPKNKNKPDKCPVPLCEASNRAERNNKGKYEDTENAHRFLLHCPKIHAMSVTNRWNFYKKNGCTCQRCFSTQHKFHICPMQIKNPKFCKELIGNKNKCGGAHHWLLHVDGHIWLSAKFGPTQSPNNQSGETVEKIPPDSSNPCDRSRHKTSNLCDRSSRKSPIRSKINKSSNQIKLRNKKKILDTQSPMKKLTAEPSVNQILK